MSSCNVIKNEEAFLSLKAQGEGIKHQRRELQEAFVSWLKATKAFINQFSADPEERSDTRVFLSQQLLFSFSVRRRRWVFCWTKVCVLVCYWQGTEHSKQAGKRDRNEQTTQLKSNHGL